MVPRIASSSKQFVGGMKHLGEIKVRRKSWCGVIQKDVDSELQGDGTYVQCPLEDAVVQDLIARNAVAAVSGHGDSTPVQVPCDDTEARQVVKDEHAHVVRDSGGGM